MATGRGPVKYTVAAPPPENGGKNIMKRHVIKINVANRRGEKSRVLTAARLSLPTRLLRLFLGDFSELLVLTPGETVAGVEIREIRNGGEENDDA